VTLLGFELNFYLNVSWFFSLKFEFCATTENRWSQRNQEGQHCLHQKLLNQEINYDVKNISATIPSTGIISKLSLNTLATKWHLRGIDDMRKIRDFLKNSYLTFFLIVLILSSFFSVRSVMCEEIRDGKALDEKVEMFLETHKGSWHDWNIPYSDGKILYNLVLKNKYKKVYSTEEESNLNALFPRIYKFHNFCRDQSFSLILSESYLKYPGIPVT